MDMTAYQKDALRTLSPHFFAEKVHPPHLAWLLAGVAAVGQQVDGVKKALFYGRDYTFPAEAMAIPDAVLEHPHRLDHLDPVALHALLGLITEAAELGEALMRALRDGTPLDPVHLQEETGDLLWYQAVLLDRLGRTFGQVAAQNIAKLRARYPEKFTIQAANDRDLVVERQVLERHSE